MSVWNRPLVSMVELYTAFSRDWEHRFALVARRQCRRNELGLMMSPSFADISPNLRRSCSSQHILMLGCGWLSVLTLNLNVPVAFPLPGWSCATSPASVRQADNKHLERSFSLNSPRLSTIFVLEQSGDRLRTLHCRRADKYLRHLPFLIRLTHKYRALTSAEPSPCRSSSRKRPSGKPPSPVAQDMISRTRWARGSPEATANRATSQYVA